MPSFKKSLIVEQFQGNYHNRPNILLTFNTMRETCESYDRLLEMVTPIAFSS